MSRNPTGAPSQSRSALCWSSSTTNSDVQVLALSERAERRQRPLTCDVADSFPFPSVQDFNTETVGRSVLCLGANSDSGALPELQFSVHALLAGHVRLPSMFEDNPLDATIAEHCQRGRLLHGPEILRRQAHKRA